jgi:hypothetical protein
MRTPQMMARRQYLKYSSRNDFLIRGTVGAAVVFPLLRRNTPKEQLAASPPPEPLQQPGVVQVSTPAER